MAESSYLKKANQYYQYAQPANAKPDCPMDSCGPIIASPVHL